MKLPPIPPHLLNGTPPPPKKGDSRKFLPLLPGLNPDARWWMQMHPVYWLPPALVFLVILWVPVNVLEQFAWLKVFCEQMVNWFPFLGNHAKVSSFPQAITAVKCVTFALIPVFSLLPFLFVWHDRHRCLQLRLDAGKPAIPWRAEVIGILLLVLMVVGNWAVSSDPGSCTGCTTDSALGLAWISSTALLVYALVPVAIATSIYVRLGMKFEMKEETNE